MVLNDFLRKYGSRLAMPLARLLSGFHPNTITWVSLLFALWAGIAFYFAGFKDADSFRWPWVVLIAGLMAALNALFDSIDGMVARLRNEASKRGDFLDHIIDRYADVFILSGIMVSGMANMTLAAFAIIGVLLTSYTGTQAQAVGSGRNYGGLIGRAERNICLIIFPVIQFVWMMVGKGYFTIGSFSYQFTTLDIMMAIFLVGGNITALYRAYMTWQFLCDEERQKGIGKP